jgi:hypothetical protein
VGSRLQALPYLITGALPSLAVASRAGYLRMVPMRKRLANCALQRTWPSFSSSIVAALTGVAFGSVVLPPEAGHAAERKCSAVTRWTQA